MSQMNQSNWIQAEIMLQKMNSDDHFDFHFVHNLWFHILYAFFSFLRQPSEVPDGGVASSPDDDIIY